MLLHAFSPNDGEAPVAGLIQESLGKFDSVACGERCNGGKPSKNNCAKGCKFGTVYRIQTNEFAGASFSKIHSFNNTSGSSPSAPLLLYGSTLYGTTQNGGLVKGCFGDVGCGTVFSIALSRD
jgi:uncharacterized repeat protein (TIGR03803 family)